MNFDSFKTNTDLENNGVWVPCGNGRVLLGSTNSDKYKKALAKALEPFEMAIALNDLPEDAAKQVFIDVFADTVVLNWEGFTEGPNDEPCPYSKDNCRRLLSEAAPFREWARTNAGRIDNFRVKKEGLEVKNS